MNFSAASRGEFCGFIKKKFFQFKYFAECENRTRACCLGSNHSATKLIPRMNIGPNLSLLKKTP